MSRYAVTYAVIYSVTYTVTYSVIYTVTYTVTYVASSQQNPPWPGGEVSRFPPPSIHKQTNDDYKRSI